MYLPNIVKDQWISAVRFGGSVLETMADFTEAVVHSHCVMDKEVKKARFLDIGTGNGVFLHELAGLG